MTNIICDFIAVQEIFKDAATFTDKAAVATAFEQRCMSYVNELEDDYTAPKTRTCYLTLLHNYRESLCFLHMEQQPETHRAAFLAWIEEEAAHVQAAMLI